MLKQVFIIIDDKTLFRRNYAKGIEDSILINIYPKIKQTIFAKHSPEIGEFEFFQSRISYIVERNQNLAFLFISGLADNFDRIKVELHKFKKEFLNLFGDNLKTKTNFLMEEALSPLLDAIHRALMPKISIIGFSGVGKTTITKLIKSEEIPMKHIPTITGDVATIKFGNLYFFLWDFAGQEQFSFLWSKFIQESDAVLLITDSTLTNVEKSKFFLDLIRKEAPHSNSAVIANKQDLPNALNVKSIEEVLGLKTYSMIAVELENKIKMIRIIADILEMNPESSPLLGPLFERDKLMEETQIILNQGKYDQAFVLFQKLSNICLELGDDSLAIDFNEKADKIKSVLKSQTS